MTKEKANRNEVVGMFLTYCRKTLVNARTDVLRERKRRRNREVLFCDLRRSELESLADWQDVPERETVFDAAGKPIGVTDKDLADALEKLCPEEQAIILLSYFAGWSDRRIGEDMGFPRSTVQNRRARALARLADILTEGGDPHGKDNDTVVAATGGDALAAGAVLDYFNDFMDGLCTGFYTDADGFWDYGIDLSMKSFMQAKLLRAMLRFKP